MWHELRSNRAMNLRASDIREAFKLCEDPSVISFAGGFPSPASFPQLSNTELANLLASPTALQYGPTEGLSELRDLIATYLVQKDIPTNRNNILITSGSQQGLDLVAKLFINPGDVVFVESPAYVGGLNAFHNYEAKLVGVEIDQHGMVPESLLSKIEKVQKLGLIPKLIYIVPCYQNPTGVTLTLERRQEIINLAKKYNIIIIEDNPYGELYYNNPPPKAIKTLDSDYHVIYLGSFSKILLPGIRVGFLVAHQEIISQLAIAKQGTDLCSGSIGQVFALEWLKKFSLEKHLTDIRVYYKKKKEICLAACEEFLPPNVEYTKPEGGFFIWLTLPKDVDARKLLPISIKEAKVAYVPGGGFFVDQRGENYIRLAFSQVEEGTLVEGMRRLGKILEQALELDSFFFQQATSAKLNNLPLAK